MKNSTTIYIVRHGETFGNAKKFVTGHYNSRLTKKGFEQAERIAEKLKNIKFAAIFSSDLTRAKQTARVIAEKHKIKHLVNPTIREKYYGIFEGVPVKRFWKEFKTKYDEINMLSKNERMKTELHPTIETDEKAVLRFKNFANQISKEFVNQKVIVIGHGSWFSHLLIDLDFANYGEISTEQIENTGYVVIETDGEKFEIRETSGITKKIVGR